MSGYYLCKVPRAEHPYYIESISTNIYSIEELCYYLSQNVYLIDETIINEKLCAWITEELGLVRLGKVLMRVLDKGEGLSSFILPIFRETGYLKSQELRYFQEQLSEIQIEPSDVRKKMKGDYLVKYGMYVSAVEEYTRIISNRSPGRLGVQFYAVVLENMATAYAKMFRFEEAAECLWESYSALKSRKVYEKYLRLLPLFLSEQNYQKRLAQIKANRDLAYDLRKDTEAILQEGLTSRAADVWENKSKEEQIEMLKRGYLKTV